jgi:hypothetical protein
MKQTLLIIVAAFCLHTICRAQDGSVPDIIKRGFEAYQKASAQAALDTWLRGSPVEYDQRTRTQLGGGLGAIDSAYGKFVGWELIRSIKISDSVRRVYITAKYEKGPLFMSFDCYQGADWMIPALDFQTKLSLLLPPSILGGL